MPATPPSNTWQEKLKAAFAADPKRTGVLAGLGLILVILCFRAMRQGPATATASLLATPTVVDVNSTLGQPSIRPGSSNALTDWLAQPRQQAKRNLFAMHTDAFARDPHAPLLPSYSNSSDESAKSGTAQADQSGEPDDLTKQAAKLKLQSTFLGPSPMALVNGQLVREGDTIEKFQVIKIEPRRIAVEKNGVTLQISMD